MKHKIWLSAFLALGGWCLAIFSAMATELNEGEVVSIVNQVNLAKTLAKPNDKLSENVPLSTGKSSFVEIRFKDASVLRLAPESEITYVSKERSLRLQQGSLVANIPPGNGGLLIQADGIQGEVTGTTLMASRDQEGNFGFVILETKGTAKVTSNTGQTASISSGQIALVRKADGSIRVFELNLDAVVQFSPLFTSFERPMSGLDKVMEVADGQAAEVKNEIKSLLSYNEVGLTPEDPDKSPLAILFGKTVDEIVASKNPFLGDLSTAAGTEESKDGAGNSGVVLGAEPGKANNISDARQPEGEGIASSSNPPSGDAAAGLGNTDTAAGAEDVAATDTAAGGGGGGADTQAPTPPVSGGVTANPSPATPTGGNG